MAYTIQFVDKIDASPSLRLDLNDLSAFTVQHESFDFSPPPLKQARIATLLRDGEEIPATAYANRRLRFRVLVEGSSKDDLGTKLQNLARELDRRNNILKYKSDGAGSGKEVFFRTFRSPDYRNISPETFETQNKALLALNIEAEPFAYGLKETQTGISVARNPATGLTFEISAVNAKGDVATPLWLKFTGGTSPLNQMLLAVRRHGTPATYFVQGEDLGAVLAADSADANASGGNVSLLNADPGGAVEWTWSNFPSPTQTAGSDDDYRGVYRIFARAKVSAGTFTVALDTDYATPQAAVPMTSTSFRLYDLGLIAMPPGSDPVYDGYTNTPLPVRTMNLNFVVDRTAGAGTLSLDYVIAIPADEETCLATLASTLLPVLDGPNDSVHYEHSSGGVAISAAIPARSGSIPMVQPNQVNRYYLLENIALQNTITDTVTLTWAYWPPFLYIRP